MPRPMPAHEPRRPHHPRRPLHQPPPVTMDQVSAQATAVTAKFRNQINQWSTMETPPSPFERFVPEKLKGQCAWVGWGWRRRGEPTRGPASTPPAASHPFPPLPIPLQPSQGLCSLLSTRGLENQVRGGGAGGRAEGAARDGHDPDPTLTATPSQLQLPQGDGRRVPGHAAVHGGEETKGGEIRKKEQEKEQEKNSPHPHSPPPHSSSSCLRSCSPACCATTTPATSSAKRRACSTRSASSPSRSPPASPSSSWSTRPRPTPAAT